MSDGEVSVTAGFLRAAPVPLAFGTSGLRGLVRDMTDLEVYVNVKGTLRYLVGTGDLRLPSSVVLGGDLRPSTSRILCAAARAILDCACTVEYVGRIPTPAIVAHSLATSRPGVAVTGSHIPFDRNGIKVNRSTGELLKSDEPGIIAAIARVRAQEYARTAEDSAFDADGMLKAPPVLPPVDPAAEEAYLRRYTGFFQAGGLAGLHVVMYQHSAVGRDLVPALLRSLGATVSLAGRAESFVPIDTENITDADLDLIERLAVVAEAEAGPVDAVVSTDGDSDRPLVVAVRPEALTPPGERRVRFLPGDLLGIAVAEALGAGAVVVPVSTNDAVDIRMRERGIRVEKCRIGSPYVIASMDAVRARFGVALEGHGVVGWEANGGFLLGTAITDGRRTLAALPTRDAVLPLLVHLYTAASTRTSLFELWSRLPARFGRSGLIDEVPTETSREILRNLSPTEVNSDGEARLDDEARARLARFFTPALGFGPAVGCNLLDGARFRFDNGDVAHIRPSGNAPQLRAYANSGTQARADEIVELMLRDGGILRHMQRAFT